jgi:hypothetical protein
MRVITETEPKLVPVIEKGKIIPGLFVFDHLQRNPDPVRKKLIEDIKKLAAKKE